MSRQDCNQSFPQKQFHICRIRAFRTLFRFGFSRQPRFMVAQPDSKERGNKMNLNRISLVASLALSFSQPASGEWIYDMTIDLCSEESRTRVAANSRKQIESSVRRAESSINPPAPVGDLGCLDGLMSTSIDRFARTGALKGIFSGSLDGLGQSGDGPSRRICSLAKAQWGRLTKPLKKSLDTLGTSLPPDFSGNFKLATKPAITERIESGNGFRNSGNREIPQRDLDQQISVPLGLDRNVEADNPVNSIWESIYRLGDRK